MSVNKFDVPHRTLVKRMKKPVTVFLAVCVTVLLACFVWEKSLKSTPVTGEMDENAVPEGFALIPAGPFRMGDPTGVGESDELPVHEVQVDAFYLARNLVTKERWDEVRAWGLANGYTDLPKGNDGSSSKGANHPVHSVSWFDVVKWCNAASEKEGLGPCYRVGGEVYRRGENDGVTCDWHAAGYRLPTEAEWEKAARGGLEGKNFPWGDTISHAQANYHSSSSYSYDVSPTRGFHPDYSVGGYPYTSPVGSFEANGYGLHDMTGNLREWCWDWYWGGYYGASSADGNPRGPASGTDRVYRGGHWGNGAYFCRAAYRDDGDPVARSDFQGFRPARSSIP